MDSVTAPKPPKTEVIEAPYFSDDDDCDDY